MSERPPITPQMKVGQLLDAYPELEDELIAIAPEFARLRNPVLRKTVARVTSLQQAALVGGIGLGEAVARLRAAAGSDDSAPAPQPEGCAPDAAAGPVDRPEWVDRVAVVSRDDARADIDAGQHPLPRVMAAVATLKQGQAHILVTPFVPAPLLDKARGLGLHVWTEQAGAREFRSLIARL
ncbi:MAG: DUF1858 domain-containing protein [bacterium]|nr:DUF1858 domain-containing protein [bacterium]